MAIEVRKLNRKFEGEIKHQGRKYGIPYTVPGDLVQFRIERYGKRGRKLIVDHIEKSENPPELDFQVVAPDCPLHSRCGGCRARHIAYKDQFRIKTEHVLRLMEENFSLKPDQLPATKTNEYRNRMDFVVEGDTIGLRAAGDYSTFIDIDYCLLQKPQANNALSTVRRVIKNHPRAGFRRQDFSGTLKYVTIRTGVESGVVVLTVHKNAKESDEYLKFREELIDELKTIKSNIQPEPSGSPDVKNHYGSDPFFSVVEAELEDPRSEISAPPGGKAITGDGHYIENLGGISFRVPYDSFFQPNPPGFEPIIDWAVKLLESSGANMSSSLVDLYSGAGVLSAVLASHMPSLKKIIGMDFVASSIERASEHFTQFTEELKFQRVDLNHPPVELFDDLRSPLLIADPPRAGLSPALRKLIIKKSPAPFFLYISCNPDSQIPDLIELSKSYHPVKAFLTDPYPQTPHLEQAVLLKRIEEDNHPG